MDGGEVWEVAADRWRIGFCDLTGGAGLLGQVEGRTAASVSAWINQQGKTWRDGVRVVAIDMCTVLKAAVHDSLPTAILVVDRFHVAQLANATVTEVADGQRGGWSESSFMSCGPFWESVRVRRVVTSEVRLLPMELSARLALSLGRCNRTDDNGSASH
jgi:hypothetical protein